MNRLVLAALLATLLGGGCKRHEPTGAADPMGSSTAPPPSPRGPGPMPYEASNAVTIDAADTTAALQQLSLELRKYVVRTRTVPRNFDEFVSRSGLQVPPPPAGKKFIIQGQAVVLVKR